MLAATGISDPDGDSVTITINAITQDEPVSSSGDGAGVGTGVASIRAERDGNGNGRVYRIAFTASDNKGGSCEGSLSVSVPHSNNGNPAIDDGQIFDSTQHTATVRTGKKKGASRLATVKRRQGPRVIRGAAGTDDASQPNKNDRVRIAAL